MADIQIYTKSNCPYCVRAKHLFNRKGVKYEEIDLEGKEDELRALKLRTGWQTVPQIFIDGKLIGGFTELVAMDSKGELNKALGI